MYQQMLSRINERGVKLMYLVFYAVRTLTVEELRFAAGIERGMTDLDCEDDLPPLLSFLDSALGLLVVEHDGEDDIVRFSHLTIKDYLSAHSTKYFPDGHVHLAQITLTYLRFTCLSSKAGRKRFLRDGDLFPFFKYATFEWGHHVCKVDNDVNTCSLARHFLLSDFFTDAYNLCRRNFGESTHELTSWQSPLHQACYFGLHSIVGDLLRLGQNINALDLGGVTPLHCAIQMGHLNVVQTLLGNPTLDGNGHHIQLNLQDQRGRTALHLAAMYDRKAVVDLLLDDPRTQSCLADENGQTPLHLAAKHGYEAVVQVLLGCHHIQLNFQDQKGRTALHLAADFGRKAVVELLLNDPRTQSCLVDENGRTPLHLAADCGYDDVLNSDIHVVIQVTVTTRSVVIQVRFSRLPLIVMLPSPSMSSLSRPLRPSRFHPGLGF
jgi:hypothetical protein